VEVRGLFGLTLLHSPVEPLVAFKFVYGLRRGSFKTWRKNEDALASSKAILGLRPIPFSNTLIWIQFRTLLVTSDCKRQLSQRHILAGSGTDLMSQ
jgi:hypothetical protein